MVVTQIQTVHLVIRTDTMSIGELNHLLEANSEHLISTSGTWPASLELTLSLTLTSSNVCQLNELLQFLQKTCSSYTLSTQFKHVDSSVSEETLSSTKGYTYQDLRDKLKEYENGESGRTGNPSGDEILSH